MSPRPGSDNVSDRMIARSQSIKGLPSIDVEPAALSYEEDFSNGGMKMEGDVEFILVFWVRDIRVGWDVGWSFQLSLGMRVCLHFPCECLCRNLASKVRRTRGLRLAYMNVPGLPYSVEERLVILSIELDSFVQPPSILGIDFFGERDEVEELASTLEGVLGEIAGVDERDDFGG
ncbi:hypothetical protein L202_06110 [Cryptococcus amylolentus CBS 6039]|uniref:Uncharacterized protein n=1 Tax=Cryptococcus amylolentus CBS 6039 TaxID=1295533 RepID=A0A1E3HIK9_9TREE|nr:hypothetical protein L202_06110 [Cryptococcus amylolentus CBS 6039]ODN76190.1 hypothetical protein L202_06110 [Cryptococcus amylolentus CBS 6039]